MGKQLRKNETSLYERDFYAWTQDQAEKLRSRAHNGIDWGNAAEEIESVGRSQKKEIRSRLKILIQHLLKWQFQPERRSESWLSTISEQRTHIDAIIEDSPSLARFPEEVFEREYRNACTAAAIETGLNLRDFPIAAEFAASDALKADFFPGPPWIPGRLGLN